MRWIVQLTRWCWSVVTRCWLGLFVMVQLIVYLVYHSNHSRKKLMKELNVMIVGVVSIAVVKLSMLMVCLISLISLVLYSTSLVCLEVQIHSIVSIKMWLIIFVMSLERFLHLVGSLLLWILLRVLFSLLCLWLPRLFFLLMFFMRIPSMRNLSFFV